MPGGGVRVCAAKPPAARACKPLQCRGSAASALTTARRPPPSRYDDIAHNPENPHPGKLFNSPGGEDVYAGVRIDYRGQDVNAENFLAVLAGDQASATEHCPHCSRLLVPLGEGGCLRAWHAWHAWHAPPPTRPLHRCRR